MDLLFRAPLEETHQTSFSLWLQFVAVVLQLTNVQPAAAVLILQPLVVTVTAMLGHIQIA